MRRKPGADPGEHRRHNNPVGVHDPGFAQRTTADQQRAFLQQQLDQLQVSINLNEVGTRVLAKADVPNSPVQPQTAPTWESLWSSDCCSGSASRSFANTSTTRWPREELERAGLGIPVLGEIPRIGGWRRGPGPYIVTREAPSSPVSEAYRTLRTSVQFLGVDHRAHDPGDQPERGRRQDGDHRESGPRVRSGGRPGDDHVLRSASTAIHEYFGLSNDVGLTSMLLGTVTLQDALQAVPGEPKLAVLAAEPSR